METSFINQTQQRRITKKAVIVAFLAVFAVAAVFCVFGTESTNLLRVDPVYTAWKQWKKNNSMLYGTAEESRRYRIFKDNYNYIQAHNAKKNRSYTLGLNQFSALTHKEWASLYTGVVIPKGHNASNVTNLFTFNSSAPVPNDSLDWRSQGRVRTIKNQGACGSCWAFAAVSALEGLAKAKTGSLPDLAEQELVDCTRNMGNYGCSGGWSQNAFQYAVNHGIGAQASYPYTARDGTCKQVTAAFKAKGYSNVSPKNVAALKQALQTGPVVVYIEADRRSFQSYKSGVLNDPDCFAGGRINHAVTAVGYTDNAWIVRNSWGTTWGDSGYVLISQNLAGGNGICGILSNSNTFPTA
jgi:C1A family cysteine protease